MNEALISDSGMTPMVVQHRDGGGVVIGWGGRLLVLSPSEVGRLIAFINGDPTAVSPSIARMLRYPVKAKEDV
jgi:hypothetical protein